MIICVSDITDGMNNSPRASMEFERETWKEDILTPRSIASCRIIELYAEANVDN